MTMHTLPVYIRPLDTLDELIHCTYGLESGETCGIGPARWVYPDWSNTYHGGQALCLEHINQLGPQVIMAGPSPREELGLNALRDKQTELDTLKLEHRALLRSLAEDIYTAGRENGLCHDGVISFLEEHFAEDLLPKFGKVFILYTSGTDTEIESSLDRLQQHLEGVDASYSLQIGDMVADNPRDVLPNLKRFIQGHWENEDVTW
jgi:hypothetical protein